MLQGLPLRFLGVFSGLYAAPGDGDGDHDADDDNNDDDDDKHRDVVIVMFAPR